MQHQSLHVIFGLMVLAATACGQKNENDAFESQLASIKGGITTSSPGCSVSGSSTGTQKKSYVLNGKTRQYTLSVPSDYTGKEPLALVFGWHGSGGEGNGFGWWVQNVTKAAGSKAIFIFPNADGRWGDNDFKLFDELVKETSTKYCIDTARVFAFGYSMGGFFTHNLGMQRATVLRGIAVVAGGGGGGNTPLPVMILHATDDQTVGFSNGEKSRDTWMGVNSCSKTQHSITPSGCVAYDGCQKPVAFCTYTGGHNTWWNSAGNAIWPFFARLNEGS